MPRCRTLPGDPGPTVSATNDDLRMNAVAATHDLNDPWKNHLFSQERPVVLVTDEHLLVGTVPIKEQRISDILNDAQTDYVHAHNVRVFRRSDNQCVCLLRECVIPKLELGMVLILDREHEARQKRFNNFVGKQADAVYLIVAGYEVRGRLHLKGSTDPVSYLAQQTQHFFPVTDATVSRVVCDAEVLETSVAIINKRAVSLFCLGEASLAELRDLDQVLSHARR